MEFNDKTNEIIGACIEVHKKLGPGFREIFYQRALAWEFGLKELEYSREEWIMIYYDNRKLGRMRVDFIVEGVLLEIKAISIMQPENYIQTLSYLKASEFNVALLINFGSKKIQVKRLVDSNKDQLHKRVGA